MQRAGRPPAPVADVLPAGPPRQPTIVTSAAPSAAGTPQEREPTDTTPPQRPATPVTITWVNVRSDPDREARILGVLDPDTPVTILESDIGWHRIRGGTLTGWVYAEGLTQP